MKEKIVCSKWYCALFCISHGDWLKWSRWWIIFIHNISSFFQVVCPKCWPLSLGTNKWRFGTKTTTTMEWCQNFANSCCLVNENRRWTTEAYMNRVDCSVFCCCDVIEFVITFSIKCKSVSEWVWKTVCECMYVYVRESDEWVVSGWVCMCAWTFDSNNWETNNIHRISLLAHTTCHHSEANSPRTGTLPSNALSQQQHFN